MPPPHVHPRILGAARAPRSPANVSEVALWYERGTAVDFGSTSYSVPDLAQAAQANDGSQPVLVRQPTNGDAGFTFAGGQSILIGAGTDVDVLTEAVWLFKFSGVSSGSRQYFWEHWGATPKGGIRIESDGDVEWFCSIDAVTSATATLDASDLTLGQENVMVWRYDNQGADNAERVICRINGVQKTLTFSGTVPATLRSDVGWLPCFGAFRETTSPLSGVLSRVIICDSLPSEADLSFLETL